MVIDHSLAQEELHLPDEIARRAPKWAASSARRFAARTHHRIHSARHARPSLSIPGPSAPCTSRVLFRPTSITGPTTALTAQHLTDLAEYVAEARFRCEGAHIPGTIQARPKQASLL